MELERVEDREIGIRDGFAEIRGLGKAMKVYVREWGGLFAMKGHRQVKIEIGEMVVVRFDSAWDHGRLSIFRVRCKSSGILRVWRL